MAHVAVEEALNLYSRDRKRARAAQKSEARLDRGIQDVRSIDDILNRGV